RAFLGKYEEYRSFFHGHTYTGNPLGCAAALANLDIFKKERVIEGLGLKVELFKKLLQRFEGLSHVGEVRQIGLVAGIELVKDKKTKEPFPAKSRVGYRACLKMRNFGVILRPLGDVVVIMPPLSIKESELKKIVDAAYRGIREVTEA
ncbi:aminotransferase class III-fold pyridoxal phosphate-dependent enzyme, partial [Albidovulum sp.]|uniref:aminotransferase class III-fold pyridoxal phosphate-dependent enzyme n=1 Tax=Albidovulum sp. TaxID=1872424 RepID=UPI0039B8F2F0